MKKLALVLFVVVYSALAFSQCGHFVKTPVQLPNGTALANPQARVCSEPATGSVCTPLVTGGLFSDRGCTVPLPNPMTGDAQGNIDFYAIPARVHLQINGPGITQIDVSDVSVVDPLQPVVNYQVLFAAPSMAFDPSVSTIFKVTLDQNVSSSSITNQSSVPVGRQILFKLCQDGVGGRSFAWPGSFLSTPSVTGIGAGNCIDVPYWWDGITWNPSGASSLLASVSLSGVGPGATGSGTYDFSAATAFKAPVAPGFLSSGSGSLGYDSTNKNWHIFSNATDNIPVMFPPGGGTPVNGRCPKWSVVGGVFTLADNGGPCATTFSVVANNFITAYNASTGAFSSARPTCANLSDSTASCSTDATNAANISSGTLPAARLPNPSSSTLGGIRSFAAVSHQWINTISTSGIPSATRPACADLSDSVASCSTDATNAANITSGTLSASRMNPTVAAHSYLGNSTGGSAAASFVQPVAADLTPGSNGQCVITSAGAATWGSCAGTAGVQIVGSPNTTLVTANANVTTPQALQNACSSPPCFGAGVLNSLKKMIRVTAYGSGQFVNNTETVTLSMSLDGAGSNTLATWVPTTAASFDWSGVFTCTVTTTGAGGVLLCSGTIQIEYPGPPPSSQTGGRTLSIATNLTGSLTPQFSVAFTTASASNVFTSNIMTVEQLN